MAQHQICENEWRVFGPPGTGKTTYLVGKIQGAAEKVGAQNLFVASFTKTAAKELAGRETSLAEHQIGTLHSHCFYAMGRPEIAETKVKEFNEEYPDYRISGQNQGALDESAADQTHSSQNDAIFAELQVNRNRLIPKELWRPSVQSFARLWEDFKQQTGRMDFTDLIERTYKEGLYTPNNATVGIMDEVQDFTPLQMQLVRHWGKQLKYMLIAGDDDQCQPAGTMVETITGPVDIADLNERVDKVLSYSRNDKAVYGKRNNGYSFTKAKRWYEGTLYTVSTTEHQTRCTDNHKWLVQWTQGAKQSGVCAVYLMQKGNRWRVGWCQLFRADGCLHVNVRANIERADRVWILDVFQDKEKAAAHESYVATQYGLPLIPFVGKEEGIKEEAIQYVFSSLDPKEQIVRAANCLLNHGKDITHPIIDRTKGTEKFGSRIFECRACNLLPGLMAVPVYYTSKDVRWQIINVSKEEFQGYVYSLQVEKYETYVADRIVTHNCVYSFSGATPDAFLDPPIPEERKTILDQSWRVPEKIQKLAQEIIVKVARRETKPYKPKQGAVGSIEVMRTATYKRPYNLIPLIEDEVQKDRSVMVIGACSYHISPLAQQLRQCGIPHGNPYRPARGDWNPLRTGKTATLTRFLSYIQPSGPEFGGYRLWTLDELASWTPLIKSSKLLQKGGKDTIDKMAKQHKDGVSVEKLFDIYTSVFKPEALEQAIKLEARWLFDHALKDKQTALTFPYTVYLERGIEDMQKPPKVVIGTIHSVKGGQADTVILFPDLSLQGAKQYAVVGSEGYDSIIRQFYVGVTRTQDRLVVPMPAKSPGWIGELLSYGE